MNIRTGILFVVTVLTLIGGIACGGQPATQVNATSSPSPAATPMKFTPADLQKVRWIEGSWRGTGVDQPPFFERYRFEGDSKLAVDSFDDEGLTKLSDTTIYEVKDGEFGGGNGGARYVATALDDNSITFGPVVKVRNSFTWRRDTKDSWTAILKWPAAGDKPAGERVYKLERWPKESKQ